MACNENHFDKRKKPMPCSDGRENCRVEYRDDPETVRRLLDLQELLAESEKALEVSVRQVTWTTAAICALMTELTDKNLIDTVVPDAETNGEINIMDFWKQHKRADKASLKIKLSEFSKHELKMIRELLDDSDS